MKDVREKLMRFILKKVREETTIDRPYYIIKWSGLFELCKVHNQDLLEIIDQMVEKGLLKKALIPSKKNKKVKLLAVALPDRVLTSKAKNLLKEFEAFEE